MLWQFARLQESLWRIACPRWKIRTYSPCKQVAMEVLSMILCIIAAYLQLSEIDGNTRRNSTKISSKVNNIELQPNYNSDKYFITKTIQHFSIIHFFRSIFYFEKSKLKKREINKIM
jgi:hypothetical protein